MKKLRDLKQWLIVPDVARHLSILFGEDVSPADVLRLALDGHLTLSVHFVNGAVGRCGPVVPIRDAKRSVGRLPAGLGPPACGPQTVVRELTPDEWVREYGFSSWEEFKAHTANWIAPGDLPLNSEGEIESSFWVGLDGLRLSEHTVLEYAREPQAIDGVWDLTMLGRERLEIEQLYQRVTGGPQVDMSFRDDLLDHPIVSREDGTYCQIHESPDDSNHYYPADEVPADSVLVVRTSALRDFEARLSGPAKLAEKPMGQRERTSLLVMIAALAKLADIDVTKPSSAAAVIESQSALMGARIAPRTIENHLKLIPMAMEDRSD